MSSMIESILGMLSGDAINNISKQVDAPKEKTRQALPDVVALLTAALANNSAKKEGAADLANALKKDHDGSILNDLSGFIDHYQEGEGNGILKHVLGNNRNTVEQSLAKKNGLDADAIGKLMTIAAPLIMGALGRNQKQEGFNLGSLTNLLGQEQGQAQSIAPAAVDILSNILRSRSGGTQGAQSPSSASKRSPIVTIIIIVIVLAVGYFLLRYLGIL